MGYKENPAWLCTRDLHDTYLSLETSPQDDSESEKDESERNSSPRIHMQAIQCAVSYSHVLSLIPLIHGNDPSSPNAKPYLDPNGVHPDKETHQGLQGSGQPFPEGYDIKTPAKGRFDLLIHVGVGAKGGISIEKLAHKRGYQMSDVLNEKAPVCNDQSPSSTRDGISEAEQGEKKRLEASQGAESTNEKDKGIIRGFGVGYEGFDDELMTSNDVTGLVEWLQNEGKVKNVKQSLDAGRYLCDFIVSSLFPLVLKRRID